ncbi:glycerophosphodiester phosphodiesterase family protein [Spirosoma fluviale]|uniref:Glycerophosphoryl diester phosphodiesterase n=1 Tax=Spirosoma fluviale TaxID=1597977 RepID=A0A286GKG2_9BACT|nr:glycerophosphodiester phosphodiesterase family protein [Spirosoma fluviale]SOD95992.1 glycerophosphoryl diester phosphodiesterase [Spirosoma fluviale]
MRFLFVLVTMLINALVSSDSPTFDIQGHRGCRGLMPENTAPAFLKALDLGVTTLEMDVVISKDRQVVVSHEPYFNAAFSIAPDGVPVNKKEQKNLILYKLDYATIKRYDVGSNGNPAYPEQQKLKVYKPLLSEVIEQTEAYRASHNLPQFSYNIEIKSEPSEYGKSQPEPAEFCDLVQMVLKKQFPTGRVNPDRIVIQSFDFAMLKQWKKGVAESNYPPVRLSALVENLRSPSTNLNELGFKPDIYSPNFRLLSQRKITWLHDQGIRVIPWTINQRADMERLKRWGVDGLITDYPDRASGL